MNKKLTEKAKRDLKLINKAIKTGEVSAYNKLMKLYRDPIYYMLFEKVKDSELAKDLTIEALGKAFKKLHLYTPDYAFSTWLFTIAKNNCIDYLRKNKLSTISIDSFIIDNELNDFKLEIPSHDPNPETMLIKNQRIKILRQIVDNLKPKYRDLVKLRYFKEMSYDEISDYLNIPIGTVKAQLHRSREQLFKIMSGKRDNI